MRRDKRRDKPRLILLCDVSDSVRRAARFMLEFVYAAQELFDRTRSFVFVSELGETTQLFEREPVAVALAHAGGVGRHVRDNSNYGRALRAFEEQPLRRDRPAHHGGHPRRRAHELPTRAAPTSWRRMRARARAALALPRAARRAGAWATARCPLRGKP